MSTRPPESKKIVLVGPAYPYRGGIAHFLETTAEGLAGRGHRVSVVTFTRQYPSLLFPGKTQYETEGGPPSVPIVRLLDSIQPLSWLRTAQHIARLDPDAVLFNYWMPFFAPAMGSVARYLRRGGTRTLALLHNALPHERRPGDVVLSRFFMKACAGFLVMSQAVEEDLRKLEITAPLRRVPHPVYDQFGPPMPKREARAELGLPQEAPVLLFFGFIRRYKGLHVLLESLPQVAERLPQVRLVVAGEFYEEEAAYRALIARHGLEERVLLHADYIPKQDVPRYFSAADIVVQPYVTATQSGVAQVAFHFEKPLIVTDVGGLAEVVPHGRAGLVVPPEDPGALASAIVRFFEEDLGAALAAGVREEKEKYSWDRLYRAVEELVEDERPEEDVLP